MLQRCYLSGKPLLDLRGQVVGFRGYKLNDAPPEEEALRRLATDVRADGPCYARAATEAGLGPAFASYYRRTQCERWPVAHEDERWAVLRSDNVKETRVIAKAGWWLELPDKQGALPGPPLLSGARRESGVGLIVPVRRSSYSLDLSELPDAARALRARIPPPARHGLLAGFFAKPDPPTPLPLMDLVRAMGVEDVMRDVRGLMDGVFEVVPDPTGRASPHHFQGTLSYAVVIPEEVAAHVPVPPRS